MNRCLRCSAIARSYSTKVPRDIKNVVMIRQHGRIFWYIDVANTRENWSGIGYAAKRGWRVIDTTCETSEWVTLKCEPINVQYRGGHEEEVPPHTDRD